MGIEESGYSAHRVSATVVRVVFSLILFALLVAKAPAY